MPNMILTIIPTLHLYQASPTPPQLEPIHSTVLNMPLPRDVKYCLPIIGQQAHFVKCHGNGMIAISPIEPRSIRPIPKGLKFLHQLVVVAMWLKPCWGEGVIYAAHGDGFFDRLAAATWLTDWLMVTCGRGKLCFGGMLVGSLTMSMLSFPVRVHFSMRVVVDESQGEIEETPERKCEYQDLLCNSEDLKRVRLCRRRDLSLILLYVVLEWQQGFRGVITEIVLEPCHTVTKIMCLPSVYLIEVRIRHIFGVHWKFKEAVALKAV